jgi:hypothetical protein
MASRLRTVSVVLVCGGLLACSNEPKPTKADVERALREQLPAFARITALSLEAQENAGTKVEPIWRSRFQATVKLDANTFAPDSRSDEGVAFVRLVKREGEVTRFFGKSISTLYAGTWRTQIALEGQGLDALGLPESSFGGKIIIRGSKEEAAFNAEQAERRRLAIAAAAREAQERSLANERAAVRHRRMIAEAPKTIVGTWRNQRGVVLIRSDGTYHIDYEDVAATEDGTWSISNDLFMIRATALTIKGKPAPPGDQARCRIVRIEPSAYELQDVTSGAAYKAARIK